MNDLTEAPSQNLIDGVDVDAVARATRGCRGVEDLHGGFPREVATYLPGRRLVGVRVGRRVVEVQVRAAWNMSAPLIAADIRAAVTPLVGKRAVDVTIAALGDPPGTSQTSAARTPDTADRLKVASEPGTSVQTTAQLGWPTTAGEAGEVHRDPPLAHARAASGGSGRTDRADEPS